MAIDVLKVLPRVGDIPAPSGRQSQLGERIILEMLQRESNMAQTEQRYALEDYGKAVEAMAGDNFFAETPYQQKLLANTQAKITGFAKQLQEAGKDSNKINTIRMNYDLFKKTDPDMRNYIQEKTALTSFNKQIENLRDKIDPVAFEGLYKHINDPNRSTPLSMADLNPGALAYDVDKVADDYLKSIVGEPKSKYVDVVENGIGKKKRVQTTTVPDDAERLVTDFLVNHPGTSYYGTDLIKQIAKRKVDAIKYANYEKDKQGKLVPVGRESEFGVYDPTPGSQAAAKATYEDKLKEKIDGDGIEGVLDDGIGTPVIVKNDGVYDKKTGQQYGKIEDKWDGMSEELKSTLRKGGYDYDKYEVAGTGKRISGNFNVEMSRSGLAPSDATYSEKIGSSSKAAIKDGYVETNNPKVLEKMGYTLSYNDKVGRYQLTDSTGKVYDETGSEEENKTRSNTGIFATSGKADVNPVDVNKGDWKGDWDGKPEGDEVSGTEKMFKVKVSPLSPSVPQSKGVKFEPSDNVDENTHNLIGYGESRGTRAAGKIAVNPSDANWVSVGHYQFNTPENQDIVFAAGGKGKEWTELKGKLKGLSEEERKIKIGGLYDEMTDDQKKAFNAAEDKIASEKYFAPLDKQFEKDNVVVPDSLKPLVRDMAIQHTTGILGNKTLYNKVKDVIAKGGDPKTMAKEISDIRGVYVNGLKLPSDVKKSILENRIPDALNMTYQIIDKANGATTPSAPAADPAKADVGALTIDPNDPKQADKLNSDYMTVLNDQYESLKVNNPNAYKNSWSRRPSDINIAYDEFRSYVGERNEGALLNEAGYKAIQRFESIRGNENGGAMQAALDDVDYSRSQEKEIKKYVEDNIGMDVWNKMPPKMQTQIYSFAFNSVKDGRIIKGIAQSLYPDRVKDGAARRKLTEADAKSMIREAFVGKAAAPAATVNNETGWKVPTQKDTTSGVKPKGNVNLK